MRVLAILGLLGLSALPCVAKGRVSERPLFSTAEAQVEMQFDLTLTPPLELGPLPSAELPTEVLLAPVDSAHPTLPSHLVVVGQTRGAMLDRCRFRMRSVTMIGHGASPDGRPETCHLLTFVGRTKFREAARGRKRKLRMRFEEVVVPDVPEPYRPFLPAGMFYPKRRIRTFVGAVR